MKKATTFVLILALLVALAGCSVDTGTQSKESQHQASSDEAINACFSDIADLFSYEDYCAFMETDHGLPEDFVYYEDGLDELGTFVSLVIQTRDFYTYGLMDKNGVELTIYFYTKERTDLSGAKKPADVTVESGSFVTMDEETLNKLPKFNEVSPWIFDTARYYNHGDGIVYIYNDNGKCHSVTWMNGDWVVNVYVNSNGNHLDNYPMDEGETFLTRLLTVETAKEAVREFNEKAFGD